MRILQICNKSPYPPQDGGSMAMYTMAQMLLKHCDLKILAVNNPKCNVNPGEVPGKFKEKTGIEWCYIDTSLKIAGALKALMQNRSYHVERFVSKDFENKLIEILQSNNFDIIQIETIYLSVYIPVIRKYSNAKIVLRAHNIEHVIWERIASNCNGFLKKSYLRILSKQLKRFEEQQFHKYDGIIAISKVDEEYIRSHSVTPCTTVSYSPDIINLPNIQIDNDNYADNGDNPGTETKNLFSLASMNWAPNTEGIQWFLKQCWPQIHELHPDLTFRIAGRHMPDNWHSEPDKGIEIVGEVPNSESFMKENGIFVIPLLSGSGIRIKIIEGMCFGKTVITTSIGAEGIDAINGKDFYIADTAEQFVKCVNHCLSHPEECRIIGENARRFIHNNFDQTVLSENLMIFYQKILN